MSIESRLKKLEAANGITTVNVAKELTRLKELSLSGNAPPPLTAGDYDALIDGCDNPKLCDLYKSARRAILPIMS